ncbi:MAG: hypothetical protein KDC80_15850, partial [Saprospiraceae bacterium]|nr:hypothetical protein [Saprospiraceae bacterium]
DIATGQIANASAQNDLTADCLIQTQALVKLSAGSSIELQNGFEVAAGAEIELMIAGCTN